MYDQEELARSRRERDEAARPRTRQEKAVSERIAKIEVHYMLLRDRFVGRYQSRTALAGEDEVVWFSSTLSEKNVAMLGEVKRAAQAKAERRIQEAGLTLSGGLTPQGLEDAGGTGLEQRRSGCYPPSSVIQIGVRLALCIDVFFPLEAWDDESSLKISLVRQLYKKRIFLEYAKIAGGTSAAEEDHGAGGFLSFFLSALDSALTTQLEKLYLFLFGQDMPADSRLPEALIAPFLPSRCGHPDYDNPDTFFSERSSYKAATGLSPVEHPQRLSTVLGHQRPCLNARFHKSRFLLDNRCVLLHQVFQSVDWNGGEDFRFQEAFLAFFWQNVFEKNFVLESASALMKQDRGETVRAQKQGEDEDSRRGAARAPRSIDPRIVRLML